MNLIIDTDPGTDDALAIAFGTAFFKQDIKAIISSYGNVSNEQTYKNLLKLTNLLGYDCPVFKGSYFPLFRTKVHFTDYHGTDGMCEVELPDIKQSMEESPCDGLEGLYNLITSYGTVKYIAIAPLTNFSKLLARFPDVVNYVDELIVMGGGLNVFNVANNAEYNFSSDPIAVKQILESKINITLCPLDLTHKLAFSIEEIEEITETEKGNVDNELTPHSILSKIFYKNYETAVLHNENGAIIHDITTLIYLLKPDLCDCNFKKIASNNFGSIYESDDGKLVKVINYISKTEIKDYFGKMFTQLKKGRIQ